MIPLTAQSLALALVRTIDRLENRKIDANSDKRCCASREDYFGALVYATHAGGLVEALKTLYRELHGKDPAQIPYDAEVILAALRAVSGEEVAP